MRLKKLSSAELNRSAMDGRSLSHDSSYATYNNNSCTNAGYHTALTDHYNQIVLALTSATKCTVPRIPSSFVRPLWNEYLD